MDAKLVKRLQAIESQIGVIYEHEERFLTMDGAKDHLLAVLISKSEATSHAAKEVIAKATPEWESFRKNLATAEAAFHRERHLLDLKLKAFDAEFLSLKLESPAIKRQL